ncbi:MAG: biotin--[acetyl-CoA-carboxylase] ligase [Sedimentisphaeraceae bacterium JB056]
MKVNSVASSKYRLFNNTITLESVDSTNNYIRRQIVDCDPAIRNGSVIIARNQTNGRGRKERSWYSGKNMSLTFSFLIDITAKKQSEITTITLAAGVAVAEAMTQFGLDCRVKWPNDIYVGNKKLCGILSETAYLNGKICAICGIGINVNLDNQALNGIDSPATSIYAETTKKHKPDDILPVILESLDRWLTIWFQQPTSAIVNQWMKIAYGLGRGLEVVESDKKVDEGFFVGLGENGQFLLRKLDGTIREIWVGDIIWEKES